MTTERQGQERDREAVLRAVGHELRDPLNTIYMGAALLSRSGQLGEAQMRTLERITRSVDRLARLIHHLLEFVRSQGSGIPIDPADVDLGDLCEAVVDDALRAHPERRVRREIEGSLIGYWDRERLTEVLLSLVQNALLYGADPICVRARASDRSVVVEVENGGDPIDGALLSGLFQPFHPRARGLGLSLFLVREIVEAHRGTIQVRSNPGEGTRFTIQLPKAFNAA